jgi:hypothetical protein
MLIHHHNHQFLDAKKKSKENHYLTHWALRSSPQRYPSRQLKRKANAPLPCWFLEESFGFHGSDYLEVELLPLIDECCICGQ